MNRKRHRRSFWSAAVSALALSGVALAADRSVKGVKQDEAKNQAALHEVELRGRVVCVPEAMHELYHTDLPSNHEHVYGFKTGDGTFYTLLRTKTSEALFVDEKVRTKELILKGRVFPRTYIFEMTGMKSVRKGVVYDLYYYCDICAIKMLSPGPCMCCQGPVTLMEAPTQ